MITLSTPQSYMVQPSDTLIRVINDVYVIVFFPANGGSLGQQVMVQDGSGKSQIQVVISGVGSLFLTNFEKLAVAWDSQSGGWMV